MSKKVSSLLDKVGAKMRAETGRYSLAGSALKLESLFGGPVPEFEIEILSDDAVGFTAPPEMVAIGPLWVAMLDSADQVRSAIRDAHARLRSRMANESARLEALGLRIKLEPPEPQLRGEVTVGGHVASVSVTSNGFNVTEVSGRRVPQKSQAIAIDLSSTTEDEIKRVIGELVQRMTRAGLLTGRGMFDVATVRGPASGDSLAKSDASASPSLPPEPSSEARKAPRPKRRGGSSESGKAEDAKTPLPQAVDAKSVDAKSADAKSADAKSADAKSVDGKSVDAKSVDGKSVDAKSVDAKSADAKSVDAKSVDGKSVDVKSVDGKSVDVKSVDAKSVDGKSVDAKSVDGKSVDGKSVDAKSVDAKSVDAKSVDAKSVDTKPMDAAKATVSPDASTQDSKSVEEKASPSLPTGGKDEVAKSASASPAVGEPAKFGASGEESLLPSPSVSVASNDAGAVVQDGDFDDDVATRQISAADIAALKERAMNGFSPSLDATAEPTPSALDEALASGDVASDAQDSDGHDPRLHRKNGVGSGGAPSSIGAPVVDESMEVDVDVDEGAIAEIPANANNGDEAVSLDSDTAVAPVDGGPRRDQPSLASEEEFRGSDDDDGAIDYDDGDGATMVGASYPVRPADPSEADEGFDISMETGVSVALSTPENSEEELRHAMEDFSSEEGDSSAASGEPDDDDVSMSGEAGAEFSDDIDVDVSPTGVMEFVGGDDGAASVETGEAKVGASGEFVDDEPEEHTAIAAPVHNDDVADHPSMAEAWSRAETGAENIDADTAVAADGVDLPSNFGIDGGETGEHGRTSSAEGTFNALHSVVGEGISSGKTGAFILDAAAFNYLQGAEAAGEIEALEKEAQVLEARLGEVRSRLVALKAGRLQAASDAQNNDAPRGRLAEKKRRLAEARSAKDKSAVDARAIASEVEPLARAESDASMSILVDADDGEHATSHAEESFEEHFTDGVNLDEVRRALSEEHRADATQLVAASFSHLDLGDHDDGGVFDSRAETENSLDVRSKSSELPPPSRSDIDSFEAPPDDFNVNVDSDGDTRLAVAPPLPAPRGPVGIVVADARALERLTRHLSEQYGEIVGLSGIQTDGPSMQNFRALVLIRPRPDDVTVARLGALAKSKQRPQVLCLSSDNRFDDVKGVDLRVELAKKAAEVAQQVVDGLTQLGVTADAV